MFKHLLIATDESELGQTAVGQGLTLARALDAKALVVTATDHWSSLASKEFAFSYSADEYDKEAASGASRILASAIDIARKLGISCDTLHVKALDPADAIVETARSHGCDLVVMASHGRRGLSRMLLASVANKVVTYSTVPVLICR